MIKIKSQTDVITNSSDETYIIKTTKTADEVEKIFYEYMEKYHEEEWNHRYERDFPDRATMYPDFIEQVRPGAVRISWDSMCNLDNAEKYIKEAFEGEPVFTEGSNHWYASDEEIERFIGGPQERSLDDHYGPIDTEWLEDLLRGGNNEDQEQN